MRRLIAGAALCAIAFGWGCGDGPDAPDPTPTTPVEDDGPITGLPVLGPALVELHFEGVVEGVMTESDASCAWLHSAGGGPGRFQAAFQGLVGGARHNVRFVVEGYEGPESYSWDGVEGSGAKVTFEVDGKEKGHGSVFVDAGGSGEIDATISSPSQGRVYGYFECPGTPR